jgi:hypothetical protein
MDKLAADLLADYLSLIDKHLAAHLWLEALSTLNECEKLLENLKAQDLDCDLKTVLWTLCNIAACHRALGASKVCANYLDACAYNSREKLVELSSSEQSLSVPVLCERIRLRKYLAKTYIQLCALLSEMSFHDLALAKARQASKEAHFLVKESLAVSYECLTIAKRRKLPSLNSAVKKTIPLLEYIERKFQNKRTKKVQKLETRNALGVVNLEDPVFSFQMGDLIEVKPASFKEFESYSDTSQLFLKSEVFDLISICVVSQYCIATELRFHGQTNLAQIKEAQTWHLRSLQICQALLPSETPMLEHLRVSFSKNYAQTCHNTLKLRSSKKLKKSDTSVSRSSHSPARPIASSARPVRSTSAKPQSRQKKLRGKPDVSSAMRRTSKDSKRNLGDKTLDIAMTDRSESVLDQLLSEFVESKSNHTIKLTKLPETRPETATVSAIDSRMSEITQPEATPPLRTGDRRGVTSIAEESSVSDELIFTSNDLYGVISSGEESSDRTTLHPECSIGFTPVRTPPRSVPSIQLLKKQEGRLRRLADNRSCI